MERDPLQIIGQTIADKYRIERVVGEGGFAVVYRAAHLIWNKPVAIKFFNRLSSVPAEQREQFHQAFIQEGALLTELSSRTASIVQARDVGTYTSREGQWMPYMVLEWLEGVSLDDLLSQERAHGVAPWSLAQVSGLLAQVASALDVAHGQGIAHRDIKPANLFVLGAHPRSGATVKILDFGVAKMMTDNTQLKAALAKTGTAVTSFTPQYAAPEQFSRGYGATGPWTDVFALALIAVEMLVGRPALDGDDVVPLAFCAANPEVRPTPRRFGVVLPDAVEAVFLKALAIQPHDRYARAREFWDALDHARLGGARGAAASAEDLAHGSTLLGQPPTLSGALQPGVRLPMAQSALQGGVATTAANPATVAGSEPGSRRGLRLVASIGVSIGVLGIAAAIYWALGRSAGDPRALAAFPSASASGMALAPPPVPSAVPAASAAPAAACPEDMVRIPEGQFFMGSDQKDAEQNQKPSHNVKLASFCMDLYEVTAQRYKACSDVGKCRRAPSEVEWPGITDAERALYSPLCTGNDASKTDHPINCVTWDMASTYCDANHKRLPTEAEWEYAARGPDGRIYPWGDEPPTAAHLNACGSECVAWGKAHGVQIAALYPADDGFPTTAPVGRFPAGRSRFGPFDVVGNVWEWVADWYGDYSSAPASDPHGPEQGDRRVIRGGAWNGSFAAWLHPSFRYAQNPKAQSHGVGFRCARSLEP